MPTETKGLLQSKTIIGVLLAVGAPFLNKWFGVSLDEALQIDITTLISDVVAIFGAVLAMYGRITAKTDIKGL